MSLLGRLKRLEHAVARRPPPSADHSWIKLLSQDAREALLDALRAKKAELGLAGDPHAPVPIADLDLPEALLAQIKDALIASRRGDPKPAPALRPLEEFPLAPRFLVADNPGLETAGASSTSLPGRTQAPTGPG
jgi:hypothetical protein